MNVQELIVLLSQYPTDTEVRIGDQIEAGPYLHQEIGGAWTDRPGSRGGVSCVILCANDTSNLWKDESEDPQFPSEDEELPLIWKPPS